MLTHLDDVALIMARRGECQVTQERQFIPLWRWHPYGIGASNITIVCPIADCWCVFQPDKEVDIRKDVYKKVCEQLLLACSWHMPHSPEQCLGSSLPSAQSLRPSQYLSSGTQMLPLFPLPLHENSETRQARHRLNVASRSSNNSCQGWLGLSFWRELSICQKREEFVKLSLKCE